MARRRYQRGCVYLRGTREPVWEARWRESVIGTDGEEKRVLRSRVLGTKKQFKNKREALRELESILSPVISLTYRGMREATFAEFVRSWQQDTLTQLKASTQPPIRSQINKWLVPCFGNCNMKDIGGQMIQMFLNQSGLSPKSRRNLVTTMRMIWKQAKAWNARSV